MTEFFCVLCVLLRLKVYPVSEERIILASASPRRRELLAGMGVRFEVATPEAREHDAESSPHLAPVDLARENARRKAQAMAALRPGRWVLGADTVVALGKRVLGKPGSLGQARLFLAALSGRTHEVITGCALIAPDGEAEIFHEISHVTFRVLTGEAIGRYLAEVAVGDKAGAYALQERGEWIVERVEGSRANVIGLPTEALERIFKRRGLL
jgi:septum formation protein